MFQSANGNDDRSFRLSSKMNRPLFGMYFFYCMLPELKYSIIPLRVYDSPYSFNSYDPSAAYMRQ